MAISATTPTPSNVKFMSVSDFKSAIGATKLEILKSPQTQKLFMSADGNKNYKVQQDIDNTQDIKVIVENDDLDSACLINVKPGAEAIFTL